MTEEVAKTETKKSPNLFELIDCWLSTNISKLCEESISAFSKDDIEKLNSLLDASIKFHQLTMSISRNASQTDK